MVICIVIAACAALVAGAAVWMVLRSTYKSQMETRELLLRNEYDSQILSLKKELESQALLHQSEVNSQKEMSRQAQENYEKALKEMKETVVNSMTAETEKLNKARENELK